MSTRPSPHGALRSPQRRMLLAPAPRNRNYPLRYLAVGGGVSLLGAVALAVSTQALPKSFPFILFYLAHDEIWLRLRGFLWTAQFPQALIWAVPLLVVLTVLAVEVLTPAGLRGLHRWFLLQLMGRGVNPLAPVPPKLETLVQRWREPALPDQAGRGGFALRVARERRQVHWFALREAALAGRPLPEHERLMLRRATRWWLMLDPASPAAAIATLEAVALCDRDETLGLAGMLEALLRPGQDIEPDLAIVATTLSRLAAEREGAPARGILDDPLRRLGARVLAPQRAAGYGPVAAAADAILCGTEARDRGGVAARDWFTLFARLRMADVPRSQAGEAAAWVQEVAGLCDLAFWAFLAEEAARRREAALDPLFGQWATPATGAEHFARQGDLS